MNDKKLSRSLLEDAAKFGIRYREQSVDRAVVPTAEARANVERFVEPMPQAGTPDRRGAWSSG